MTKTGGVDELRRKAEGRMTSGTKGERKVPPETQRLIHELQVHQIELEMQNDELQESQQRLEELHGKYSDLFDFAPVGYFILDRAGRILEVNLTGAGQLGCDRSTLIQAPFLPFVLDPFKSQFQTHLKAAFDHGLRRTCEIELQRRRGAAFWACLESVADDDQHGRCRMAVIDISLQKEAQQALSASDRQYRDLVEAANSIILRWSPDGEITFMNPYGLNFFGYREEELLGRPVTRLIPSRDSSGLDLASLARKIVRHPESYASHENENIRKNGERVWVSWSNRIIQDESGKAMEVLAIGNDITRRKKAEAALLEAHAELEGRVLERTADLKEAMQQIHEASVYSRSLIETSLDPLVTINAQGKIMDVNEATELATGQSRARLIGSDFADYFTDPDLAREGYRQVFEVGLVRDYPLAIRHASGQVMDVLYNASVYRNEAGEIQGVFAAARDITDRKKMEEIQRESEALYHHFFQNSVAGTFRFIYDPLAQKGRRLDCNKAFTEMMGYKRREDLVNQSIRGLFMTDQDFEVYVNDLLQKKALMNYQITLRRRDGSPISCLLNASMRSHTSGLMQVEGTLADISERVDAEKRNLANYERLRSLTSELVMAEERERRHLAADLHDNIGQILALTKMNVESLRDQAGGLGLNEPLLEIGDMVDQTIQQTRSLLMDLSPPVLYELGLAEAVDWLAEQMQGRHNLKIRLDNQLKDRRIDKDIQILMFRATRELLMNIIKHAQVKEASVSLKDTKERIHVTVEDRGAGIDGAIIGQTSLPLNGFGLVSIRERLKYLGGSFAIKTGKGTGTCICLTAPRKYRKGKTGGDTK